MRIPRKELERLAETELDTGMTLARLHRHFCNKMTLRGMCGAPGCGGCQVYLQNILGRVRDEAEDPYAVLVWSIRTELADMVEETKEAEPMTDWMGDPIDVNPFELLHDNL